MTRNFVFLEPTATLYECAKKIVRERVNTIPITKNKKLKGIISSRDILWALTKKPLLNLKKINVMDIACRKVAVIKPSTDISQAMLKMRSLNFKTLPVMFRGELIGIITIKDILRVEPDLYQAIGNLADIKEEERKLKQANIEWPLEGFCDNCGAFSDLLKVEAKLLCYDCREELY